MSKPRSNRRRASPSTRAIAVVCAIVVASSATAAAQEQEGTEQPRRTQRDSYLLGDEPGLEMVVHVLGEVKQPGEYRVPDDTDVLELISKAGGPTDLANLGNVSIRRHAVLASGKESNRVIELDVKGYLERADSPDPPQLAPSDVVMVPRNNMSRWRTAFAMIRDVSVVVTAYLLYLRVEQND